MKTSKLYLRMEDWFIKHNKARLNFSESGVPDFKIKDFLKMAGEDIDILSDIFLGNNDTLGSYSLRKFIANTYRTVGPKNLIITTGASEGLFIFSNLFFEKKSKMLILHPAFPLLYQLPQSIGVEVRFIDILKYGRKDNLLNALAFSIEKYKPDLLLINIPHNPTGMMLNEKEIEFIGQQAKKSKVHILFDEHYRFLPINTDNKEVFPSGYDIVKRFYENVYAVGSIIKCTGIVGVRIGWLIANHKFIVQVRNFKDFTTHCVPLVSERFAQLAIFNVKRITKFFRRGIENNCLLLKDSDLVKDKKIILNYELEGGCVCFPKISNFSGQKFAEMLYKKYSISVMPGEVFNCKGYIRINMAQKTNDFKYLLKCISQTVTEKTYY